MNYLDFFYRNYIFYIDYPLVIYGLEVGDSLVIAGNGGSSEMISLPVPLPFLGMNETSLYVRSSKRILLCSHTYT